jgi:Cof subfamily protein (haloacid dehalogenase superfamily)
VAVSWKNPRYAIGIKMIKIIASDIDGTLLQNRKPTLSPEIFEIIKALHKQGILFVAASGRQYPNLYRLFEPVSDHMAFICENGSLIMYQNQVVLKTPLERSLGIELMEDIWNREGCEILLSGQDTSYLKPKSDSYVYLMRDLVKNNVKVIKDYKEVTEDFIKISVFEEAGIADHSGDYFTNKWQDKLKCTISGHGWLDFTAPNVNKGSALKLLLNKLSITVEEAMAFGDNFNDLEMLELVKHGYVMENAAEVIKDNFSLQSRTVEETLIKHFNLSI